MKKTKKASHFLKQYFVFSKSERKGIYVLLVLITLTVAAPYLYRLIFPAQPTMVNLEALPATSNNVQASFINDVSYATLPTQAATAPIFAPFNPNTADSATLASLGFTVKNVKSILNYRKKGGKFRRAQDLYKLYHVDSQLVTQLLPFVQLDTLVNSKYPPKSYTTTYQPKNIAPVELNTADSQALVKLYGIGPKMASKIVTYRNEVGGFFTVNQLNEIWGFDPLLIDELKDKITVDVTQVRYLRINQVTYEELKKHPYLSYKQAAALVNYRKQHGPFTSAKDLKNVLLIPDSTCSKLEPYLRFD